MIVSLTSDTTAGSDARCVDLLHSPSTQQADPLLIGPAIAQAHLKGAEKTCTPLQCLLQACHIDRPEGEHKGADKGASRATCESWAEHTAPKCLLCATQNGVVGGEEGGKPKRR
eukprot:CAMPEP_0181176124 /NCGR_PEP_ID=MMETSP1096-20121128/4456_1 /TAXON_ID=156174 ORGANISM="Chrysochromulina ericina, Strain CCMP281" /NCGR_SAMPLE_ID=MMETSP1096 /ASSEMBLY_ACC=CAM_ASM_000453 /LENGTH=113 /DNA_ID=CAMNT_0023264179 /DNA_START=355 /DNA_END=697 /DNA_ORIENTATION=-